MNLTESSTGFSSWGIVQVTDSTRITEGKSAPPSGRTETLSLKDPSRAFLPADEKPCPLYFRRVCLPSITSVNGASPDAISNLEVEESAETCFSVNRMRTALPPILPSAFQVHVSPSTVPREKSFSPKLFDSK